MSVAGLRQFGTQGLPDLDSTQIHEGYGYTEDGGIEPDLRDAIAGTTHSGTAGIQRVALSRMLGL